MKFRKIFLKIIFGIIFLFVFLKGEIIFAGTIDPNFKYAWGEKIGWVNFGCENCNVIVTDEKIEGYAWSENYGWINLSPSNSGVKNDGQGNLSGYAWGENLGWIDFSGVKINSEGEFTGEAKGEIAGTINFDCQNCKVKTDWRPGEELELREGGGVAMIYQAFALPKEGVKISIEKDKKYTNKRIVKLFLQGGKDCEKMAISNFEDFRGAILEKCKSEKEWDLCKGIEECQDGLYRVFAKFFNQFGRASQVVFDEIFLDTKPPKIEIERYQEFYSDEKIVLEGKTESLSKVFFFWKKEYGLIFADKKGNFALELGRLNPGFYQIKFKAKDRAQNESKEILVKIKVKEKKKPILKKIPEIFKPFLKPKKKIKKIEEIPKIKKELEEVMRGKWSLLSYTEKNKPLVEFTKKPLPKELKDLVGKFPKLALFLEKIGIKEFEDLPKLKKIKLTLPGLTKRLKLPTFKIKPGKFALPQGVPLDKIPLSLKKEIPSEVVFVRDDKELIDFNAFLSLTKQGKIFSKVKIISGKTFKLVIKPERQAKEIKGYLIFKRKKPKKNVFSLPQNYLSASLIFANPIFAKELKEDLQIEKKLLLLEFEYQDQDGDGIWTAEILAPRIEGEYEVLTVIEYKEPKLEKKVISLIFVVDPEGYVFEREDGKELRIEGAVVSLFWLNPETKKYELWPAHEFYQENPQVTDKSGRYSFLVPEGTYYLRVEAPGYLPFEGKSFKVKTGEGIHFNIELKPKFWWLKVFDWKTILLILISLLLLYNFWRDKIRERRLRRYSI